MRPTWVLSAPDGPHVGHDEPCSQCIVTVAIQSMGIASLGRAPFFLPYVLPSKLF